jgi:hypothetical protein
LPSGMRGVAGFWVTQVHEIRWGSWVKRPGYDGYIIPVSYPSCPAVPTLHIAGGDPDLAHEFTVSEDGTDRKGQYLGDSKPRKPLRRNEAAVAGREPPDDREEHPFFKGG